MLWQQKQNRLLHPWRLPLVFFVHLRKSQAFQMLQEALGLPRPKNCTWVFHWEQNSKKWLENRAFRSLHWPNRVLPFFAKL